jgi:hypothetical protein
MPTTDTPTLTDTDYARRSGRSYALSRWAGRCSNGRGGRLFSKAGDAQFIAAKWLLKDWRAFEAGAREEWTRLKSAGRAALERA